VPEISVLIDWDTLRAGVFGEASVSESASAVPLTPEAVRRMACDGRIVPVVLGGDGVPLDVGRSRRLATPAQRRALAAMYRTCAHPHCSRPLSWCQIHHVRWWELGGPTDLANMVPLCDRHHHEVHDGGWTLTIDAHRVLTWTTPAGTVWFSGNTCDRPPVDWDEPPAASRTSAGRGGRGGGDGAGGGGGGGPRADGDGAAGPGDGGRRDGLRDERWRGERNRAERRRTERGRPAASAAATTNATGATGATGVTTAGVTTTDAAPGTADDTTADTAGVPTADTTGDRRRRRSRNARRPGTTLFDHDTEPAGP
jgi:hypothetical protein